MSPIPYSILPVASSHIKLIGTPSSSPPPLEAGVFANNDDTVAPLPIINAATFFQPEDFEMRNTIDTAPEWELDVLQEGISKLNYLEASQALWDNADAGIMDFFDIPDLGSNYLQSWQHGPDDIETEQHQVTGEDYGSVMTYTAKKNSLNCSDNNLSCLLNSSLVEDPDSNVVSSPQHPSSPRFGIMLQSRTTTPINAHRSFEEDSAIIQKATDYKQSLEPAIFCGTDPATVIMSFVMMQKAALALIGDGMHKVRSWNSPTSRNLSDTLDGDWLRSEIENLVCSGYEAASKSIRQRQGSKSRRASGGNSGFLVKDNSNEVPASASLHHASRSKCIDYYDQFLPTGKLRIQLNVVSKKNSDLHDRESLYRIQVCFIPNPHICTTGVSALFSRINMTQGSLPAQIITFNVVPDDAEIIRRVRQGDIEGVRSLFERKQASARDVDPGGFSLLSVSKLC